MLTRRATTAAFRTQSDRRDLTTNINNQRSQAHAPDSSSYMHKCLWDRVDSVAQLRWQQFGRSLLALLGVLGLMAIKVYRVSKDLKVPKVR